MGCCLDVSSVVTHCHSAFTPVSLTTREQLVIAFLMKGLGVPL
jgi:hypothetical protein